MPGYEKDDSSAEQPSEATRSLLLLHDLAKTSILPTDVSQYLKRFLGADKSGTTSEVIVANLPPGVRQLGQALLHIQEEIETDRLAAGVEISGHPHQTSSPTPDFPLEIKPKT